MPITNSASGVIEQSGTLVGTIVQSNVLTGTIQQQGYLVGTVIIPTIVEQETEEKTITPSSVQQVIFPSSGKLISKVTVEKIPNNYGLITYNGHELTVS